MRAGRACILGRPHGACAQVNRKFPGETSRRVRAGRALARPIGAGGRSLSAALVSLCQEREEGMLTMRSHRGLEQIEYDDI